jgi:hypothetical protein
VQRPPVEPAERGKGFEASWYLGGVVGVYRPGATVVAGVERGEQIYDLRTAHLADHDPVRPHPQRLPHQVSNGHFANAFDIGATRDELDQMRMCRLEFGGVLHADDALVRGDGAQYRGQQRRLVGGSRFGSDQQNNATAPRQSPVRAPSSGGHIEQHGRCGCPHFATRWVGRVNNRQAGGRRDAVHVISDCGVAD